MSFYYLSLQPAYKRAPWESEEWASSLIVKETGQGVSTKWRVHTLVGKFYIGVGAQSPSSVGHLQWTHLVKLTHIIEIFGQIATGRQK